MRQLIRSVVMFGLMSLAWRWIMPEFQDVSTMGVIRSVSAWLLVWVTCEFWALTDVAKRGGEVKWI